MVIGGYEYVPEMSLVDHGRFTLLVETLGWDTDATNTMEDLLAINDPPNDGEECEGR